MFTRTVRVIRFPCCGDLIRPTRREQRWCSCRAHSCIEGDLTGRILVWESPDYDPDTIVTLTLPDAQGAFSGGWVMAAVAPFGNEKDEVLLQYRNPEHETPSGKRYEQLRGL
jgi:hypothetical protein